ncbi:hypothetical protein [Roseateles amylovorans]|uniref:Uncharacterized protein n=1 Tax=Roseateles amylovorans TaxID=2978473 RepID=A0ABY6B5G7_9BURK|nr:hypothetical protein [Roseateles amylovorans]UXH80626.1 hypothetical protein N4261_12420 [Roseateles amylovorans]
MIIEDSVWKKYFDGYTVFDCAIFRQQGFFFILVEEKDSRDVLPKTRLITLATDRLGEAGIRRSQAEDFSFSSVACGVDPTEYVVVDTGSNVYSASGKSNQFERKIEDLISLKTPVGTMVTIRRVVRVAGKLYAVGSNRRLYRREGVEKWVDLHSKGVGAPMPADYMESKLSGSWSRVIGFKDLSAFSETDFYAAGGEGDLWRFDGKTWTQCPLPTNAQLETVCCAGDGKVYVTDLHGNVWAGREEKWAQVATSELSWGSQPVDAFWFKGRMLFGAQEGLYVINGSKQLVPLGDVEDGVPSSMVTGRIDISPDGNHLLTAGPYGACLYDGKTWTRLFSAFDYR